MAKRKPGRPDHRVGGRGDRKAEFNMAAKWTGKSWVVAAILVVGLLVSLAVFAAAPTMDAARGYWGSTSPARRNLVAERKLEKKKADATRAAAKKAAMVRAATAIGQGHQALMAGNNTDAERFYREGLDLDPSDTHANYALGLLMQVGKYDCSCVVQAMAAYWVVRTWVVCPLEGRWKG